MKLRVYEITIRLNCRVIYEPQLCYAYANQPVLLHFVAMQQSGSFAEKDV
jgi:hypothetical protein